MKGFPAHKMMGTCDRKSVRDRECVGDETIPETGIIGGKSAVS